MMVTSPSLRIVGSFSISFSNQLSVTPASRRLTGVALVSFGPCSLGAAIGEDMRTPKGAGGFSIIVSREESTQGCYQKVNIL
jgi:hypothetical protein